MIDDGMSPTLRGLLFQMKVERDRASARARALAARPKPPDGHHYLDVATAQLAKQLQLNAQAYAEVQSDVEGSIQAGELRAVSARKKLRIRPGTKFDPDDCLVSMAALFAWAGIDAGQSLNAPANSGAAKRAVAAVPAPPESAARAGVLTTLFERACLEVGAPWRTADVWACLRRWAESQDPPCPLVEAKERVIIYMDDEFNKALTYQQFEDRMSRWRKKQGQVVPVALSRD